MGHIRLGVLPATRDWRAVVALLSGGGGGAGGGTGGGAAEVAGATAFAAREGFEVAKREPGLIAALHILMQLPFAARQRDFLEGLRAHGIDVTEPPSLLELNAALMDTLDRKISGARQRTDLSEMAELAAVETLTDVIGARLPQLFDATPDDVRAALAEFGTRKQFGFLARAFFGRFTERYLGYYLSRELSTHVGQGERFENIAEHTAFNEALRLHCFETARIVEDFAGGWLSKARWEKGAVTERDTRQFLHVALRKLSAELTRREASRGR